MINLEPIKPLLREDYVSPHLQEQTRKREIKPLPFENAGQGRLEKLWLWIVRAMTKLLRIYG